MLHDVYSNQDGCEDKNSFTVPSAAGQQRAITEIFERTQYDPQRIFYVEAHGTGTQVGDPIEANTLGRFFHRMPLDPPLLIGSVKSNIGHTEGAAGIASLIKVAMCLKHKAIPPNMHFIAVNPKIELQSYNMHVVQTITPFPLLGTKDDKGLPVAMSINSFGVGGNNAHAIVEEYCSKKLVMTKDRMVVQPLSQQPFLFLFSSELYLQRFELSV